MNHSRATGHQRRAEELVCWTRGERIRFLWYRLCLTVQEIIIANGRMIELEMGLTPPRPDQLGEILPADIAGKDSPLPGRGARRANRGADGREIQPAQGK